MYYGPQRKSQRLKSYDYCQEGFYFLTFCTKGRIHYFGDIHDEKMILNNYGNIFDDIINETVKIRKEITLYEYAIMPNHVHILISIPVGNAGMRSDIDNNNDSTKNLVSNYVQGIKSKFTREIRNTFNDYEFAWQKSFYDVIIRNDEQLAKSREYIIMNPMKWDEDVNNI